MSLMKIHEIVCTFSQISLIKINLKLKKNKKTNVMKHGKINKINN